MEVKKYDKYKLEKKKFFFFQIGFIVSISIVILAFEFVTVEEKRADKNDVIELELEFEPIEIIRKEKIDFPAPKSLNYKSFKIVDDKELDGNQIAKLSKNSEVTSNFEIVEYEEEELSVSEIVSFNRKPIFKPGSCNTKEESEREILKFMKKNIKYPKIAIENNIQAKVYVRFLIDKNGILKSPQIVNKTDEVLEIEALRVVKEMNDWEAGYEEGRAVDMWYTIPIIFYLK